jgi:uncharacterized protein (TIGR02145 family)
MKITSLLLLVSLFTAEIINAQTGKTVKIGKQEWMSKNLDVATFRKGEPIPEAKTDKEWVEAGENKQPAWCYYNNYPANEANYGKLYNWYAVADPRGLCPVGWHVPSDAEWTQLTDYLGGEDEAGVKMKAKEGWHIKADADGELSNGSNSSGFSGIPAGGRINDGTFASTGSNGIWWSSSEYDSKNAWNRNLYYFNGNVSFRSFGKKQDGFSVRCLRD